MEADDDFIFEVLLGLTGNVQATCGYWKKFSNDITARERVEHHGPPQLQVQARGGPERAPGRPWTAGAAPHDVGRTDITSQAHRAADSRAGKELELRAQLGPAQYEGPPDHGETKAQYERRPQRLRGSGPGVGVRGGRGRVNDNYASTLYL